MFHRPPKKYSEYLVNVEQSIDWILKTLWRVKKGEGIVTKINAGTNITVNPAIGTGEVTINASVPATPTLAQVTTAGNTTTNAITVGGLTVATNLIYTDTVNGRVGIGTTSPTNKLHIVSNAYNAGNPTIATLKVVADTSTIKYPVIMEIAASTGGSMQFLGSASAGFFPTINFTSTIAGLGGGFIGITPTDSQYIGGLGVFSIDGRLSGGPLSVANIFSVASFGNIKMVIAASGNLLINTTTDAGYKLDVNGTMRVSGSLTVDTNTLFVDAVNDRVGIGTTSPSHFLDVAGIINSVSGLSITDVAYRINGSGILGKTTAANFPSNAGYTRFIGTGMLFSANNDNTVQMVVMPTTGKVGVGTTSPVYKLEVRGTAAADAIRSHIGFDIYPVPDPVSTLTTTVVAGTALGIGNYYYGVTFVTALGETHFITNAIATVTTSGNQAINLSSIPVSTDSRVTSRRIYRSIVNGQYYNVFLVATIADNTTTTYSDTTPDASLGTLNAYFRVNSTTNNITVGGTKAMSLDSNNVAFGPNAALSLTVGGRITAIGSDAGRNNTTGSENVYLGFSAASGVTTGSGNTYLGVYTAQTIGASGAYNVGVGRSALQKITGGSSSNTALGAFSLLDTTSANNNTAIGFEAGKSNTTGANNIFIGYQATGVLITESNRTWIGNSSTTSTWLAGNVLVGTTTNAGYKLDVNGTFRTNDRAYIGEDVTFTSAQYYYLISPSADGQVTFTNSTVTNGHAQGFFGGELNLAGNQPYLNHRAINIVTTNRNTSTGNIVRAFYASGRTGNTGAANTVAGFLGGVNIEGSGNVTNAIGLEVEIFSQTNNKTITNMYGVKVQPLVNSVGTITNTYGVYIDSLTAGTQTNAAYGIYQAGSDRNYFGGNVGIGTASPTYKLDVNGTVNSLSGYLMNGVAGWTGTINIPLNPPGQQNIDVQGGIIVNVF